MRTTIDLPEELHRALKARAGLSGITFRQLVKSLIEIGLRAPTPASSSIRRAPPVIIASQGVPIPAVPRHELMDAEDAEDAEKYA
ncbi:MAG TPA: hypothetical protein VJO35_11595 [Terriglobales bacterium]|nr:hypothetical protein [Terriglobales bacterium]